MSEKHHHNHRWNQKARWFFEAMQNQIKSRYLPFANTVHDVIKKEFGNESISLLDLGCGPGILILEIFKKITDISVLGIDPSADMLKIAREEVKKSNLSNITFKEGYGEDVPVENESVQVVTCLNSLHDFKDPRKAITEISRILVPNGVFILRDRNGNYPKWKMKLNFIKRIIKFGLRNTKKYFRSSGLWLNPSKVMDWMSEEGFQIVDFRNKVEYIITAKRKR